jgi:hypothetical protein
MKTADDLREIVKKYLDDAALSELENDLEHQTVRTAAHTVMIMLDDAMMDDKITIDEHNEASKLFDWVGAYPECRESELNDPATG